MSKNPRQMAKSQEIVMKRMSGLLGEVLTILEAVIPHNDNSAVVYSTTTSSGTGYFQQTNSQVEATKSLVRSFFTRAQDDIVSLIQE